MFNILLVEDNPAHAEMIIRSFEQNDPTIGIHHVSDGEAALDCLFGRGDYAAPRPAFRPDVILLDLRLPRRSGLETLQTVKSAPGLRCIPVIVLTTSEAEGDLSLAYQYRANSYLVKPVQFDKFVRLMQDIGVYWLEWNRGLCAGMPTGANMSDREAQ